MAMSNDSNSLMNTEALASLTAAKVAIIYTEWNDSIVSKLMDGCTRILEEFGAVVTSKTVVPGAFELPYATKKVWEHYQGKAEQPEAIIVFGAVIRGGTPHFDYVSKAVTDGILQLNINLPIPVIFGVLTLDNEPQAWERLGGEHGHKGEEAAIAALKMIQVSRGLQ